MSATIIVADTAPKTEVGAVNPILIDGKAEARAIADFKNPFEVPCVDRMNLFYYTSQGYWTGSIRFVNGNTVGEQNFKGDTIADCLSAMQAFIEALKAQS